MAPVQSQPKEAEGKGALATLPPASLSVSWKCTCLGNCVQAEPLPTDIPTAQMHQHGANPQCEFQQSL